MRLLHPEEDRNLLQSTQKLNPQWGVLLAKICDTKKTGLPPFFDSTPEKTVGRMAEGEKTRLHGKKRPTPAAGLDHQWPNCRLCFGPHHSEECPEVPWHLRDQLLATREQNYVTRRTEGTLPSQLRQR